MEKRITAAIQAKRNESKASFNNFLATIANASGDKNVIAVLQCRGSDGAAVRPEIPILGHYEQNFRTRRAHWIFAARCLGRRSGWAILSGKRRNSSGRPAVHVVKLAIPVHKP